MGLSGLNFKRKGRSSMKFRLICITIVTLCLLIQFPIPAHDQIVSAQTDPPTSGNWVISDTTTINGVTIILNGSLIIETSGTLNLLNSHLILNNSATKSFSIVNPSNNLII